MGLVLIRLNPVNLLWLCLDRRIMFVTHKLSKQLYVIIVPNWYQVPPISDLSLSEVPVSPEQTFIPDIVSEGFNQNNCSQSLYVRSV